MNNIFYNIFRKLNIQIIFLFVINCLIFLLWFPIVKSNQKIVTKIDVLEHELINLKNEQELINSNYNIRYYLIHQSVLSNIRTFHIQNFRQNLLQQTNSISTLKNLNVNFELETSDFVNLVNYNNLSYGYYNIKIILKAKDFNNYLSALTKIYQLFPKNSIIEIGLIKKHKYLSIDDFNKFKLTNSLYLIEGYLNVKIYEVR